MNFQNTLIKIIQEEFQQQTQNKTIGVIAGSFRIPYKYDIDLINEFSKFCDEVIVDISNISVKSVLSKTISKTNIEGLANIFSKIESENDQVNQTIKDIQTNIEQLTYIQLEKKLNQLIKLLDNEQLKEKLNNYLTKVKAKLCTSIKYYNGQELTGELIQSIFEILFSDNPKIKFKLSEQQSPVLDAINYVNLNYKNCDIYIETLNKFDDKKTVWQLLMKNFLPVNKIIEYLSVTKPTASREYILKNFNQLSNTEIFGNLAQDKANKVREILNNDIV